MECIYAVKWNASRTVREYTRALMNTNISIPIYDRSLYIDSFYNMHVPQTTLSHIYQII